MGAIRGLCALGAAIEIGVICRTGTGVAGGVEVRASKSAGGVEVRTSESAGVEAGETLGIELDTDSGEGVGVAEMVACA